MPYAFEPLIDAALLRDPEALAVLADALLEHDLIDSGPQRFLEYSAWSWAMVERTELSEHGVDPDDIRRLYVRIKDGIIHVDIAADASRQWLKAFGGLRIVLNALCGVLGKNQSSRGLDQHIKYALEYALRAAYPEGYFSISVVLDNDPHRRIRP